VTILLVIIYLVFIGLGLPDSMLGTAWPVMHTDISASLSWAGTVSVVICAGTVCASLLASRAVHRFGAGKVSLVSTVLVAAALIGTSFTKTMWQVYLCSVPLGLGAGAIDSALNNFVSLNYKAKHMNWLHCFWGVGAMTGPVIISRFVGQAEMWRGGYRLVGAAEIFIVLVLIFSLPLWNRRGPASEDGAVKREKYVTIPQALKIGGVIPAISAFLCYCAFETSTGVWTASFLVTTKGFTPETSAWFAAFFYFGIMAGRLACGFLTAKLSATVLIRCGCAVNLAGFITLLLPVHEYAILAALLGIGIGAAPFFPQMVQVVPERFGVKNSQTIIGMQSAAAFIGATCMPPLIGAISARTSLKIMPPVLICMSIGALTLSEVSRRKAEVRCEK